MVSLFTNLLVGEALTDIRDALYNNPTLMEQFSVQVSALWNCWMSA
jgi:hypothetical protein